MKKKFLNLIIFITLVMLSAIKTNAVQFDVAVIPTDIFSVCENYFCFPEPSEIVANDVIKTLNSYKYISSYSLSDIRSRMNDNPQLKLDTQNLLEQFSRTDKIDFPKLQTIAKEFGVKSVILISCYASNDKSDTRRDLWEIMEISNAFKTTYPFTLTTRAVLTDNVNNVVMWSGKYIKTVTNSDGLFSAENQTAAASQLEKIKLYSKNNISQTISQNIRLRFFPKEVRTFDLTKPASNSNEPANKYVPNALEKLNTPKMLREIEQGHSNSLNPEDDFIFEL